MADKRLTTIEAAELLGYTQRHVNRLIKTGTLAAERFADVYVINAEDVARLKALQRPSGRLPKRARSQQRPGDD